MGYTIQACELSVVKVPSSKPLTRSQYKQAMEHWPVTFHEDKRYTFICQSRVNTASCSTCRLEKIIRCELFTPKDLELMGKYMGSAISVSSPQALYYPVCNLYIASVILLSTIIWEYNYAEYGSINFKSDLVNM